MKTVNLDIFRKFFYEVVKFHTFSALFSAGLSCCHIFDVFKVICKVFGQDLINQIRWGDIVIGSFNPQSFVKGFFDVECGLFSCAHKLSARFLWPTLRKAISTIIAVLR